MADESLAPGFLFNSTIEKCLIMKSHGNILTRVHFCVNAWMSLEGMMKCRIDWHSKGVGLAVRQ